MVRSVLIFLFLSFCHDIAYSQDIKLTVRIRNENYKPIAIPKGELLDLYILNSENDTIFIPQVAKGVFELNEIKFSNIIGSPKNKFFLLYFNGYVFDFSISKRLLDRNCSDVSFNLILYKEKWHDALAFCTSEVVSSAEFKPYRKIKNFFLDIPQFIER